MGLQSGESKGGAQRLAAKESQSRELQEETREITNLNGNTVIGRKYEGRW